LKLTNVPSISKNIAFTIDGFNLTFLQIYEIPSFYTLSGRKDFGKMINRFSVSYIKRNGMKNEETVY
jgi:hypothetical protein